MHAHNLTRLVLFMALVAGSWPLFGQQPAAAEKSPSDTKKTADSAATKAAGPAAATTNAEKNDAAANPAPLDETTKQGLRYLANQQHADGGWGQGGGWRQGGQNGGRVEGNNVNDPSDVGNSCIAVLALIRAGSTPTVGEYSSQVQKGVEFIRRHIESADKDSIFVTDVRDTQLQSKIGSYVDTFLAALVLSELKSKGALPENSPALAALNKTIAKIEKNQKADGTFDGNRGWASVLSQGLCGKAINYAKVAGVKVNDETLRRDFDQAKLALAESNSAKASGGFIAGTAGPAISGRARSSISSTTSELSAAAKPVSDSGSRPSDAGVALYADGSNSARLQDRINSLQIDKRAAELVINDKNADESKKVAARGALHQIEQAEKDQKSVVDGIVKRLEDKGFVAGFGNNGGEEFLSYMNIGETLAAQGGHDWKKWSKSMAENLTRVQNGDGSWSGQHCITGRTFCTSAALLTLMSDRAPLPAGAKLAAQQAAK